MHLFSLLLASSLVTVSWCKLDLDWVRDGDMDAVRLALTNDNNVNTLRGKFQSTVFIPYINIEYCQFLIFVCIFIVFCFKGDSLGRSQWPHGFDENVYIYITHNL